MVLWVLDLLSVEIILLQFNISFMRMYLQNQWYIGKSSQNLAGVFGFFRLKLISVFLYNILAWALSIGHEGLNTNMFSMKTKPCNSYLDSGHKSIVVYRRGLVYVPRFGFCFFVSNWKDLLPCTNEFSYCCFQLTSNMNKRVLG